MSRLISPLGLAFVARRPLFTFWGAMLLFVSVWLLAFAVMYIVHGLRVLESAEAQRAAALTSRAMPRVITASSDQIRQLNEETRAVNQYTTALNTPWDRILRALQVPSAMSILLTGFETTTKSNVLTISGEAGRLDDVTDYVALLSERRIFTSVQLIKHELPKEGESALAVSNTIPANNANSRIRFTLEATWPR
jgi:Tfp pilus assembly protein PilN